MYRIGIDGGVELITSDSVKPNGVTLSHDEALPYVADTETGKIWAVELDGEGHAGRRHHVMRVSRPDGLAAHFDGRLLAACLDGIVIIEQDGVAASTVRLPERPANLVVGETADTFYVCARPACTRSPGVEMSGP